MSDFDKFPDKFPKEEFDAMRKVLADIPNIGMGGCGISALAMYRWLQKRGYNMRNVKFVMGYSRESEAFKTNFNTYINEDRLSAACTHMGLLIQDTDFDLTVDAFSRWYFNSYQHVQIVSEEYILGALNGTKWNRNFDRATCIPMIEDKLDILLLSIKTSGHFEEIGN